MPMDFDEYFEVLSSAAENYDDKVGSTTCANTHQVNMHSTSYDNFSNDPYIFYDVDMDVDTIMANSHNMVLAYYLNGTSVPDDAWSKIYHSLHEKHGRAFWLRTVSWLWVLVIPSPPWILHHHLPPAVAMGVDVGPLPELAITEKWVPWTIALMMEPLTWNLQMVQMTLTWLMTSLTSQYNVNFATLCANVAEQKNSELIASGKHVHYHPPKCTPNL